MTFLKDDLKITEAGPEDLDELVQLENHGFPPDEAASKEAFAYRLKNFPDWFLVARLDGRIVGLINGIRSDQFRITDDVFLPDSETGSSGSNLLLSGLVVHSDYRKKGIAERLMKTILKKAKDHNIKQAALTCRKELIPYYEKFGFINLGISLSVIGNVTWYDMVVELN